MENSNPVEKSFKNLNIFNWLLGTVIVVVILMFSYNLYLYYKTSQVSDAYAKKAYEIYRDRIFPVFEKMTMKELLQRKQEYDQLRGDKQRWVGTFEEYLYRYYQLDWAMGAYSNVNASGLRYFAARVQPVYFGNIDAFGYIDVNMFANIPMAVDVTMSYLGLSQDEEQLQHYFHREYFEPVYKSVEEMVVIPIYIHKSIMKVFNEEFFAGHSYYTAINKVGEFLNNEGYYYDGR